MNFLIWYGIGIATIVITLFAEAYKRSPKNRRIRRSFSELYSIFYKEANWVSNILLVPFALLGPLLPIIFAYFIARNWYDVLPEDEDGKKVYPWNDD